MEVRKLMAASMICAAMAAAGLLAGCSSRKEENIVMGTDKEENRGEGIRLTFLGFKADAVNLIAIESSLQGFMQENPDIMVTYEGVKGFDYWVPFDKRAASGHMDDIMMIDHDHVLSLCKEDKLADLSGLSTIGDFEAMAKSQFTEADGSVYFLPLCISFYGMYVNRDLLEAHGQKVPENLAEFSEVCDYFVSQGVTPVIVNNYASIRNLVVAKGFYPIYQKEHPEEEMKKFNDGEASIIEQLRPGIELVETMIQRGWIDCDEALVTRQTSDDLILFADGERPFMVSGGWASPRVAAMQPGFEYEVWPFPVLNNGSVLPVNVDTCISINADSNYLEEVKRLVEHMTKKDVLWEYCQSQVSFTPLKDSRMPSDSTIEPAAAHYAAGNFVVSSDYTLTLSLDTALNECGTQMLMGLDAEGALDLLSELLVP